MPNLDQILPDEKSYGENIVRTNRIISWILCKWTKEPPVSGENRSYLRAIYFDKLAEFVCRFWNALYVNRVVRYPSAYKSFEGIHGPGRAVRIDREQEEEDSCGRDPGDFRNHLYAYIGEIIEKLPFMANDTRALFKICEDRKPWTDQCEFSSGINANEWEAWIKEKHLVKADDSSVFLESHEIDLVDRLAEAISKLSDKEIRAIGTHHSASGTIKAIEFNRKKWFKQASIICGNAPVRAMGSYVLRLNILADEIYRKSQKNCDVYLSAWNKLSRHLTDGHLYDVFVQVQHEPDKIWKNSTVYEYGKRYKHFSDFSVYLKGVHALQERKVSTLQYIEEANKIVPSLNAFLKGAKVLVPPLDDTFVSEERFFKPIQEGCRYFEGLLPSYRYYKSLM